MMGHCGSFSCDGLEDRGVNNPPYQIRVGLVEQLVEDQSNWTINESSCASEKATSDLYRKGRQDAFADYPSHCRYGGDLF
mmetsp:Transcript_3091/g.7851  ORF Transcript_3091/g.7851 Transcript_3091/m.7851 type:complete len:80 (+) Transcript_3091:1526-1765(+)